MTKLETVWNLKDENAARVLLEDVWKYEIHKTPEFSTIDWYAYKRGYLVANIEYRRRRYSVDDFPTVIMNYHKYCEMRMLYMVDTKVDCIYMWEFDDGIYYVDVGRLPEIQPKLYESSRRHGVASDVEPVVYIERGSLVSLVVPSDIWTEHKRDQKRRDRKARGHEDQETHE